MAIKILGGLAAENFVSNETNEKQIDIQRTLFNERFTNGVQLRVDHDYTNGQPLEELIKKVNSLDIPYIVHGPAENLGVDLGQTCDQANKFTEYKSEYPHARWDFFNKEAIDNAHEIAKLKNSLDSKVILHIGYAPYEFPYDPVMKELQSSGNFAKDEETIKKHLNMIKKFLENYMENIPINIETVPFLRLDSSKKLSDICYGFGSLPEQMKDLLKYAKGDVVIDFTHSEVTANQMKEWQFFFKNPRNYEKLIKEFLELNVSKFTHFSGHTKGLWDVHDGFIKPETKDEYAHGVVLSALQELNKRHNDIYIALEIKWNDLENSKREIDAFYEQYKL